MRPASPPLLLLALTLALAALAGGCGEDGASSGAAPDPPGWAVADVGLLDGRSTGVFELRACADANLRPTRANLRRITVAIRCLVNAERALRGLRPLRPDARLRRAARRHATDMVARGYFAHDTPSGRTLFARVRTAGYVRAGRPARYLVGENLAWGRGRRARPAAIVRAWLASPTHRRVLLTPRFEQLGIGVLVGVPVAGRRGTGATYATAFGARRTGA